MPFLAVVFLVLLVIAGVKAAGLYFIFGVLVPYAAAAAFLLGFVYRVVKWGKTPVPFHIPTTCGQQKSLSWIKPNGIENPSGTGGVVIRMLLEVLLFRSLFKNRKTKMKGEYLVYGWAPWLWLAGMAFHWSFLLIVIRHLRFFFQSVPAAVQSLEHLDSILNWGVPALYITDVIFLVAVTCLFLRRVTLSQMKAISLPADFFPLFLLLGIGTSGVLMRYQTRVDVVGVKELVMGLVSLHPSVVSGIGTIFYVHLFLISALFAYFPWSKLVHAGGVFLSPTRNLSNNSRVARHVNPWSYPVKVHTYEEYEDDFREKMKMAGVPVERE